jgi:hypothetical protein
MAWGIGVGGRPVKRYLLAQLTRLILRLSVALALYGAAGLIPWPAELARWAAGATGAALVMAIVLIGGKLLYDTFFPLETQHRAYFWPRDRR